MLRITYGVLLLNVCDIPIVLTLLYLFFILGAAYELRVRGPIKHA